MALRVPLRLGLAGHLPGALTILAGVGLFATLMGCRSAPPPSEPVRLVDRITEATITGSPAPSAAAEHRARWTFGTDLAGWSAAQGVEGLRLDAGALTGRASSSQPVLVVALPADLPPDEVWSIEIRAQVSAGANLTARFDRGPVLVLPRALGNPMGIFNTPLQPGDQIQEYSIRPGNSVATGEGPGHLLISPSDRAGADFAIESVRLVLRSEYLHSVPSGVSWQGLSEIYRETIVSRAPEVLSFDVQLPAQPFLELAVGALETGAMSFRVRVEADNGKSGSWSETINEAGTWHSGSLDLTELGGQEARVSLALESAQDGAIGLWGAPAIRSRAAVAARKDSAPFAAPTGVVVILADTLRSDHLDAWGYGRETAPTLSRLAREGVRFGDCISQSTWTKVSVPAIQTSLYPTTHTIRDLPDRLPAAADTLAETYRQAGYATLGLVSIPFVGRMTNLHQGYETLHEAGSLPNGARDGLANGASSKTAAAYVDRLMAWIDQRDGSPFFALLHIADPHAPYRPRKEHELRFAEPGGMDRLDQLTNQVRPGIEQPLMKRFGLPSRVELERAKIDAEEFVRLEHDGYDGSISGMDDALAKLIDHLATPGLAGRVLVVLISDHGTEFLEHDHHFHGHTVYGELNRVPLIFWGPGVPAGVEVAATVQTIDMMPTLLELSGLPVPEKAQGQSLRPFFTNPATPWRRPAITELPFNTRGQAAWSIIADGWKLIRIGPLDAEPQHRLYDHRQDPLSLHDLAAENPKIVARLAQTLVNWHAGAQAARLDDFASTATLDADELERLRSLGYIQ